MADAGRKNQVREQAQHTLRRMIQAGLLQVGQTISFTYQKRTANAILQTDGSLAYGKEIFQTPSSFSTTVARRFLEQEKIKPKRLPSVNGWDQCFANKRSLNEYRRLLPPEDYDSGAFDDGSEKDVSPPATSEDLIGSKYKDKSDLADDQDSSDLLKVKGRAPVLKRKREKDSQERSEDSSEKLKARRPVEPIRVKRSKVDGDQSGHSEEEASGSESDERVNRSTRVSSSLRRSDYDKHREKRSKSIADLDDGELYGEKRSYDDTEHLEKRDDDGDGNLDSQKDRRDEHQDGHASGLAGLDAGSQDRSRKRGRPNRGAQPQKDSRRRSSRHKGMGDGDDENGGDGASGSDADHGADDGELVIAQQDSDSGEAEEEDEELADMHEEEPYTKSTSRRSQAQEEDQEEEEEGWKLVEKETFYETIKSMGRLDLNSITNALSTKTMVEVQEFYDEMVKGIREWYEATGHPCGLDGDNKEVVRTCLLWWELSKRVEFVRDAKRELEAEVEELREQVDAEIDEKGAVQRYKQRLENEVKELRRQAKTELKTKQALEETKRRLERDLERLKKDGDARGALERTKRKLEAKLEEVRRDAKTEADLRQEQERRLREAQRMLEAEQKTRREDADTRRRYDRDIEKTKKRLEAAHAEIATLRQAEVHAREATQEQAQRLVGQLDQMRRHVESVKLHNASMQRHVDKLNAELKKMRPEWDDSGIRSPPPPDPPALSTLVLPDLALVSLTPATAPDTDPLSRGSASDALSNQLSCRQTSARSIAITRVATKRKGLPWRAPSAVDSLPGGVLNFAFAAS